MQHEFLTKFLLNAAADAQTRRVARLWAFFERHLPAVFTVEQLDAAVARAAERSGGRLPFTRYERERYLALMREMNWVGRDSKGVVFRRSIKTICESMPHMVPGDDSIKIPEEALLDKREWDSFCAAVRVLVVGRAVASHVDKKDRDRWTLPTATKRQAAPAGEPAGPTRTKEVPVSLSMYQRTLKVSKSHAYRLRKKARAAAKFGLVSIVSQSIALTWHGIDGSLPRPVPMVCSAEEARHVRRHLCESGDVLGQRMVRGRDGQVFEMYPHLVAFDHAKLRWTPSDTRFFQNRPSKKARVA